MEHKRLSRARQPLNYSFTGGTVKTHVKNLLEKLDATSRTEALAVAARRGLITL